MFLKRRHFLSLVLVPVLLVSSGSLLAEDDEATALVRRTAERMLGTLEARRAEIEHNPALIYGLVETIVLPHFDFERITQGAVGQYWRQATPDQQRQLVDGFKQVLIRTYARSLLSYSGQEIRYLPSKPGNRPTMVTVATEVREPGAAPIPVEYRMYNGGSGWKVYDVVINNASLVGNYRSSFAAEIRQNGIDGLIARLSTLNQRGEE
ncbi:MlaC/ttg2D family ABC transporter substrate-binding protein [Thermochromatium tepidum]|uniref:ABC transporter substrate-binding protein n=1 Tax=Thermochromatium tepidum ATCC 43061 TaxID=316276 RepID=A0A6I6EDK5_THETI|nr:ABC transporter substrate-binding protein [Thermochromatium tepidum]QGU33396.1 ABC transporter substrate-binding protein [Thermochromatium tepidum ATCC 43061]